MAVSLWLTATLLEVLALALVCDVPVGLALPRYARDDPYAHHRSGHAATSGPLERTQTIPPIEINPAPDLNVSTPAPRLGSSLHAVKFMQQFGYVPKGDKDVDLLFTSQSLEEAIKRMQKFGNIPQTGVIDNATIELMQTPRCGLPDLDPEEFHTQHIRRKRYIVGGEGWKKRRLTYLVANWSPQLRSKKNMQRELRRAFDAWSTYSNLLFTEVDTSDADIIIYFASYDHGDGYAFDGPSGILAHAYYPYEFGHYGGDVHFDESEQWNIRPKDEYSGLDFFTVAVHEIGHSLGLAHSPVSGSIMFPYYKGYTPTFALDYDDVMAMWELYIKRKLEGDDEFFNTTTTTTPAYPDTDHQSDAASDDDDDDDDDDYNDDNAGEGDGVHRGGGGGGRGDEDDFYEKDRRRREEIEKRREEERRRKQEEEEERRRWEEEIRRREEETRRREEEERRRWEAEEEERVREEEATPKPPPPVPDLCHGGYDAMAVLRQELFIFKGEYLWRFSDRGHLRAGYPGLIVTLFPALPSFLKKVDAVYERITDSNIVFFIGKYYYVHNGDRLVENSPRPLTDLGLPELQTQIDAAFYWPRAKKTYFFSRDWYFRYNDQTGRMDEGYPKDMSKWNGLPGNLDAAFTWKDGKSYFLRGAQYWQYDNVKIRPVEGYPREAPHYWVNCPRGEQRRQSSVP
ncbi:matrix metalloproteinase-2-like isoform X2 [Panulirus ornatus]|uniref:matrix metalloproteinase-2-like isoform X2 n=1 Tax=Panulirus ornatus TaxID=150431 RepID=UPI003A893407